MDSNVANPESAKALKNLLALPNAEKGVEVAYHTGLLMRDRVPRNLPKETAPEVVKFEQARAGAVDKAAKTAMELHDKGIVSLVQRRLAPGICAYLAIRN